ncbi:methylated-DNA--[protein]-cysteine S-methyltransferase [Pseudomonadota bacterium]
MSSHIITSTFKSPVGELILGSFEGHLYLCDWRYRKQRATIDKRIQKALDATYMIGDSEVIEETMIQLDAYFHEERKTFDLPLHFAGTYFQKGVWEELAKIPYGETVSYTELSNRLNNPLGIRAVASANGANAISIIVPCHRIIGANGDLVGYAGGLHAKKKLLELEGAWVQNQLDLFA